MSKKAELIGQVGPEQIEAWKKAHKEIFQVVVDGHIGYLRKPDRKIIAYASSMKGASPFQYMEALVENCWIGGSKAILEDDDLFIACLKIAEGLVEVKSAELVKL